MVEKNKEQNLYKKTDGVLFNYKTIKAEIDNLELDIDELKEQVNGVSGISYEEKTGPTNKFSSSVENEILKKEKEINKLLRERSSKKRLISKIDNAMETLNEDEKRIIELRCFERKSWTKVGMITKIEPDYCGRIKRKVINKLSELIWIRRKYTE